MGASLFYSVPLRMLKTLTLVDAFMPVRIRLFYLILKWGLYIKMWVCRWKLAMIHLLAMKAAFYSMIRLVIEYWCLASKGTTAWSAGWVIQNRSLRVQILLVQSWGPTGTVALAFVLWVGEENRLGLVHLTVLHCPLLARHSTRWRLPRWAPASRVQ